jgi:hypothetical protein
MTRRKWHVTKESAGGRLLETFSTLAVCNLPPLCLPYHLAGAVLRLSQMFMFSLFLASALLVHAYIPASPTNNTNAAIQQGLNVSDVSKLQLQWFPNGSVCLTLHDQRSLFEHELDCHLAGPFSSMCHIS